MAEEAARCAQRAARWAAAAAAAAGPPPVAAGDDPRAPKKKRKTFIVQPHTSPDDNGQTSSPCEADPIHRRPDAAWARTKKRLEQAAAGETLQSNMGKGCNDM